MAVRNRDHRATHGRRSTPLLLGRRRRIVIAQQGRFPVAASMENIIDDHAVAFDEIGDHRLAFMDENSQAVSYVVARCAALREINQQETGGAQSLCEPESHSNAAAGLRDKSIKIDKIGLRLGPKYQPPGFQVAVFRFCSCIFLRRSKTSSAGILGRGSSIDF